MIERIRNIIRNHPTLTVYIFLVGIFVYTTAGFQINLNRDVKEREVNARAFCGLVYLFDQSVKLRGDTNLGPLQEPYDQWKKDVASSKCPKKPDVVNFTITPTTSTTLK